MELSAAAKKHMSRFLQTEYGSNLQKAYMMSEGISGLQSKTSWELRDAGLISICRRSENELKKEYCLTKEGLAYLVDKLSSSEVK